MHHVEIIDKLLKNELSATETYQQAMDIMREDVGMSEAEYLMPIYEEHKEAVNTLQAQIRQLGGTPSDGSGAWGVWAELVQGGANIMGKETALKTLQEGEKSGAEDYEEVLEETDLSAEVRSLIESKLLPTQQSHVVTLDRLINTMAA